MSEREELAKAMWEARQQIHGHFPDDGRLEEQPARIRDWVLEEADAILALGYAKRDAVLEEAAKVAWDQTGAWWPLVSVLAFTKHEDVYKHACHDCAAAIIRALKSPAP